MLTNGVSNPLCKTTIPFTEGRGLGLKEKSLHKKQKPCRRRPRGFGLSEGLSPVTRSNGLPVRVYLYLRSRPQWSVCPHRFRWSSKPAAHTMLHTSRTAQTGTVRGCSGTFRFLCAAAQPRVRPKDTGAGFHTINPHKPSSCPFAHAVPSSGRLTQARCIRSLSSR
ncbi:hypothetical protein ZHAS_00017330 [Anopheles sinensis]|uniref:Uncharacterized protein n=1 Tax=Anopheles sinensis TaxID=74873 RepID=A0A084WG28_ANOSI|nr:hypothetical protein ZHAS_00017330 [Anopheles sinensis]